MQNVEGFVSVRILLGIPWWSSGWDSARSLLGPSSIPGWGLRSRAQLSRSGAGGGLRRDENPKLGLRRAGQAWNITAFSVTPWHLL